MRQDWSLGNVAITVVMALDGVVDPLSRSLQVAFL